MNVLNQWLEELYQELQGISEDDRKDILESYEEQINEMIDLKINEREILSKLGSPKKVAQEIKQSFTDTETVSAQNKQIVFNIREKTNDDVIKKAIFIVVRRWIMNAQYKKGVLELCVLKLIQQDDLYGYETVQKVSFYIEVTESTIYPLLRRLTKEGYLSTYNRESNEGPPRKYYSMTVEGEVYLATLIREWDQMVDSVQRLLKGV